MTNRKEAKYFKFIILGDQSVGKSALIQRFNNNKFSYELKSTIGAEFVQKKIEIDGK